MRIIFLIFFAFALTAFAGTPQTEADWQREAVRRFPELGVLDSELNKAFREEQIRLKATNPEYFKDPKWSLILTEQCVQRLKDNIPKLGNAPTPIESTKQPVFKPTKHDQRLARARERATQALVMASRQEQLQAALAARMLQQRGGRPLTANEFQIFDQDTRRVILLYVPDLLPPELLK